MDKTEKLEKMSIEHIWWDVRRSCDSLKNKVFISIISLQMAAFVLMKAKGAGKVYLDMILFLAGITLISWIGTTFLHGNHKFLIDAIVLFTIGNMLQCIFRAEQVQKNAEYYASHSAVLTLQLQYVIAIMAAIMIAFIYRRFPQITSMKVCRFLVGISLALGIVTLLVGHGSVRNWIVIGGFSIQTTEILKYFYVFIGAGLLGTVEHPSRQRIWTFYGITILEMGLLVLQSEFGTLLLIGFVFLVLLFLFLEDVRYVLGTIAATVAGAIVIACTGNWLSKLAQAGSILGTNPVSRVFLSNYTKIANRITYWLDPEKDALGLGYQLLKAKESIVLGGLFGTSSITDLPVHTSDLVYPALIERCGMVFALLIFIVYILMFLEGMRILVRKEDRYHRMIIAGFSSMLFIQTLIIIGGSTGLCPLTGITLPFISSGGTSLMVSFMMVSTLIAVSGNVAWKGTGEYEKEEFFKTSTNFAKHNAGMRHSHDSGTHSNISDIARNLHKGRRTKRKSKTADI